MFHIPPNKPSGEGKRPELHDASELEERLWKIVYIIFCLALLTLTAYQFLVLLQDPKTVWDYHVFAGAVQALDHGQNPYIPANINQYVGKYTGGVLPFTYPPHTLYFFWLLDLFLVFHSLAIYYGVLVVLLLISGYLIVTLDQRPQYLFFTTLLLTGFMAAYANFVTGNKDILFLLLFALVFVLLVHERYWQSSILIGLAAAVSLIMTPFAALILAVRRPIPQRLAWMFLSAGVVAVLFAVSYCINPAYFNSYIGTVTGQSTSPMYDRGGSTTPTPYLLFWDLLNGVNLGGMLPVAIVSFVYVVLILYATWNYGKKNREDTLKLYSLVMLAIFMMLPRIKPYDFIVLVVPLYYLFKDCSYKMKSLVLVVISLVPYYFSVFSPAHSIHRDLPLFLWPFAQAYNLLEPYALTYSLILIFLVVILHDRLTLADCQGEPRMPEKS